jgi:excisionase family DNA binding protein
VNITDYPPLLTAKQTAELLQTSTWTVYEKVRRHELPALHMGRAVRIPRDAVLEHLAQPVEQPDPNLTVLRRELERNKRKKVCPQPSTGPGTRTIAGATFWFFADHSASAVNTG